MVTGGTSNIGYGTVHRFARRGANVILSDLPQSNGEKLAKELGDNVHFVPADITSEKDVKNLIEETHKKFGGLHVVVNCAGISCGKPIYDFNQKQPTALDDIQNVLKVRFQ